MSGCPVRCKFCATGNMKGFRNLTADEIAGQVDFVLGTRPERFCDAFEHKVNYTRMGEPFLNIENVKQAILAIEAKHPGTHHYLSTIGIRGSDFSFIQDNITLQISVHSFDEKQRDWLIPVRGKMSLEELGAIRTGSSRKTTVNLTMIDERSFDIEALKRYFDPGHFFIKLSPINANEFSVANGLEQGLIPNTRS